MRKKARQFENGLCSSEFIYYAEFVRWRVKVNLHSLGVCQLFVLSAHHLFNVCCIRESVYHRNKNLLQVFNLKAEGSFVYMVKIKADLIYIVVNMTKVCLFQNEQNNV